MNYQRRPANHEPAPTDDATSAEAGTIYYEEEEGAHLRDYVHTLRKHVWAIVLVFVVVVASTAVYTFRMEPIYRAKATLEISPPKAPSWEEIFTPVAFQREYFQTQVQKVKSRATILPVYHQFALEDQTYESFADAIETEPRRDTSMLDVTLEGTDPERITEIVNKLTQQFVQQVQSDQLSLSIETDEDMRALISRTRSELESARGELEAFKKENDILSIEQQREIASEWLTDVGARLRKANGELTELEARRGEIQKALAEERSMLTLPFVADDTAIEAQGKRVRDLREDLARFSETYGENHPDVRSRRRVYEEAVEQLEEMAHTKVEKIQGEYATKAAEVELLTADYEKALSEAKRLDEIGRGFEERARRVELSESNYHDLQKQRAQFDRNSGFAGSVVEISEPAVVPERPVKPRKLLNLTLAALVGTFLGVFLAFFLEYIDDSVKTPDDVERYVHLPLLGIVPDMAEERKDLTSVDQVAARNPRSTVAEAYRAIRTSLTYASADEPLKTFLVTSAGPGEGKTTNASNLAIVFAQSGQKTLLLDADMRRPRIHRIYEVDNPVGLTSVLARRRSLEEALVPTDIPNLSVLPTGPIPPNPAEILGSEGMKGLLEKLSGIFDRIVIDSPPIVAVTDPCVLGPLADGVIQICLTGATSRKVVKRGRDQLLSVGTRHLGLVLNAVKTRRHGYDYYYAGYYYYRYYGEQRERRKSRRTGGAKRSSQEKETVPTLEEAGGEARD